MRIGRPLVVMLIATSVIALFFIPYFQVLRHPAYPLTVMPLTALDRLIPFQPHALFAYVSLWVYVGLDPACSAHIRTSSCTGSGATPPNPTGRACPVRWPTICR